MKNNSPVITSANFLTSAPSIKESPMPICAEVLFMGRSNVGKSSLINALTNRKGLAKSSQTPGKTTLINFFEVEIKDGDILYKTIFVDVPGFGYAKVSKDEKKVWERNLTEFLEKRDSIKLFLHLKDSRLPPQKIDEGAREYLDSFLKGDQKVIDVYTKADKLNRNDMVKLERRDSTIAISSENKMNIPLLLEEIIKYLYKG